MMARARKPAAIWQCAICVWLGVWLIDGWRVAAAQQEASPPEHFDGDVLSDAYFRWQYRWKRGGAWQFHAAPHACWARNVTCAFSDAPAQSLDHRLRVNTTLLDHLDYVRVQYATPDKPIADGDFLGVYCEDTIGDGDGDAAAHGDFFDFAVLPVDTTEGHVDFGPLVNYRCSYQFRLLRRRGDLAYACAQVSPYVEMRRGHSEPTSVHIALTERSGEMRIMWTSGWTAHPVVRFGSITGQLSRQVAANTSTYAASDLCEAPATIEAARWFRPPGFLHEAVLTDLQPGTTYFYTVGSMDGITSREFAFLMPPQASTAPLAGMTQTFIVFGDLGQGELRALPPESAPERHFEALAFYSRKTTSNRTVMDRIALDLAEDSQQQIAAVVHAGDLSYAKGRAYIWDQFGAVIQPVAAQRAYMISVGNHEYDYLSGGVGHDLTSEAVAATNGWHPPEGNFGRDSHGECGVPTIKRFHMPDTGNRAFWYSFTVGLAHHIVLSSEHDCNPQAPMHQWFLHEMRAKVDRRKTPWLLVHLHRPLYCSEQYESDMVVAGLLRTCWERVFAEHHVDVVFAGHYHAYERTCPVFKQQCRVDAVSGKAQAPIHLMIGSAGAELDDISYLAPEDRAWSISRRQDYGYGRFHVVNASHAHFEFVLSRDRSVADEVWIESDHAWTV